MTFFERIKLFTPKEMKMFIYWCYQNGWTDRSNNVEDSPGDWSFFGGAICDKPAEYVEAKLDDYYDKEWRDELLEVWCLEAFDQYGSHYHFERKLRCGILPEELKKFKKVVCNVLQNDNAVSATYPKGMSNYNGNFDEWLKKQEELYETEEQ